MNWSLVKHLLATIFSVAVVYRAFELRIEEGDAGILSVLSVFCMIYLMIKISDVALLLKSNRKF